jgi:hypothetical protein
MVISDPAAFDERASRAMELMDVLIRRDPGARGLASKAGMNPLEAAARSLAGASRVLIATGFCVRAFMIGETDGPPGAAILADALAGLGIEVGIVTDRHSAALVRAACGVYGLNHPVFEVPIAQAEADRELVRICAVFRPGHVVAIERPGSAMDGSRYSMRGECLDDIVPGFDALFAQAPAGDAPCGDAASGPAREGKPSDRGGATRGWITIGIGDGGNELGMGSLPAELKAGVAHGEKIFASHGADFPIVAGVSNWGGWALAAATLLAARSARRSSGLSAPRELRDPSMELRALEAIVGLGAVDGATKTRARSVDGLPPELYLEAIEGICGAYREAVSWASI